jgi:ABC-2 type transport system permease protein
VIGLSPTVGPLLRKELRQVSRSRRAMITAALLPFVLMVFSPVSQLMSLNRGTSRIVPGSGGPPGIGGLSNSTQVFLLVLLPLFVTLGAAVVPSVSAAYTVVAERERGSLDLLIALPVSVGDILLAKLLAMLVLSLVVVVPMYAIDLALVVVLGGASAGYFLLLTLVLAAALLAAVAEALLVALLARDFRTANNLNGLFVVPVLLASLVVLLGVPGLARLAVLATLLLLVGALEVWVALRWLTFERYLA